jgi:hypothetical protein
MSRPLTISVGTSIAAALLILLLADRYLTAMVADEYRTGLRTTTDGDSIGLPLGALAMLLGALLVIGNAIFTLVLIRRRRRSQSSASRPAV